jgi:hypothetical protein
MRASWRLLGLLLLVSCASPDYRISKNPEFFATLSPEDQVRIRQGEVAIGFSRDMVVLAQGRPNRIYERESADSKREVWSYTRVVRSSSSDWVRVPVSYRDADGKLHRRYDSVRVDVDHDREVDQLRVEFSEGRVSAIERLQ